MTLRGPVLVGTNLSSAADEALDQGARLADELASPLIVCHVIPEVIPDGSVFAEFRHANLDAERSVLGKARAAVQQQVDSVLGASRAPVEILLDSGTPHVGLLRQAEATGAGVVLAGPESGALEVVRSATTAV